MQVLSMQALLDGVKEDILVSIRTILADLCSTVYELICDMYSFFMSLAKIDLLSSDAISDVYIRVSMLLGLIMLFRLLFSFIQMMINPDLLEDKNKGAGNIILRVIIVIILLGSVPEIFRIAIKFQNLVLDEGVIERVILSQDTTSNTTQNAGSQLSYGLFRNFYYPDPALEDPETECPEYEYIDEELQKFGTMNLIYSCLDKTFIGAVDISGDESTDATESNPEAEKFSMHFDGWTALAVGIFVLWILLMYTISVGARVIQLAFLQIIAPIPIISYIMPNKNETFQKWVKQCVTTYLDLFIRIAIISFIILMCNIVLEDISDLEETTNWIKIFLILGLLIFGKKAPELLKELFPSSGAAGSSYGFSMKDRAPFGKALAATGGAAVGGVLGFAGGRGIGRFTGLVSGTAKGLGKGITSKGDSLSAVGGSIKDVGKKQNERNLEKIRLANDGTTWYDRFLQRTQQTIGYRTAEERMQEAEKVKNSISSIKDYCETEAKKKTSVIAIADEIELEKTRYANADESEQKQIKDHLAELHTKYDNEVKTQAKAVFDNKKNSSTTLVQHLSILQEKTGRGHDSYESVIEDEKNINEEVINNLNKKGGFSRGNK